MSLFALVSLNFSGEKRSKYERKCLSTLYIHTDSEYKLKGDTKKGLRMKEREREREREK